MGGIDRVQELIGGSHFHQAPGRHPGSHILQPGHERIEVMTGGRGWVRAGSDWIELRPGDLLWHVAGDETIGRSDFDDPYRCLSVHFRVTPADDRPVPHLTRWEDLDEVKAFTREIIRAVADERFDRAILCAYVYSRLLYRATRSAHRDRYGTLPRQLAQALELIDSRYADALGVEDLAAAVGWSVTHLHAIFKQELDSTPHQALIQRRLRAARELLASTDLPIAEVAVQAGIPNPTHFSRSFRQSVGMTPLQYRHHHTDPVAR